MSHKTIKPLELDHQSPCPYGKYAGAKMENVPVGYLHWHWHNCKGENEKTIAINNYIHDNVNALRKEDPDLIWS